MHAPTIQAVRGMNDVLPEEAALWERIEEAARETFAQYGYRNLRVPIVEPTALFVRGIGDATDIVEKEMYTFDDHGESLTLRPEATAGIVRAAIEHNLTYERAQRVWTAGPMFRHERPQKGRYRRCADRNRESPRRSHTPAHHLESDWPGGGARTRRRRSFVVPIRSTSAARTL